jgi:allantoinase
MLILDKAASGTRAFQSAGAGHRNGATADFGHYKMSLQAFRSSRVVTPEGVRSAAILVENEAIRGVVPQDRIPQGAALTDFGDFAILPGLVDSHTHVNEPGRTEWEGFVTAARAAAAGGYTLIVDMPLNCLPPTTTVESLQLKRSCAANASAVDFACWGGVVSDNQEHIEPLAAAGVPGFKCFLVHPGIDGFTMVTEQQLREALPRVAKTGLPLLVHAELPGPIETAARQLEESDWRCYDTYLRSRPDEAELRAIALLLCLCREFGFRLHIVHLATSQALDMLRRAKSERLPVTVETCPHYLYFSAEQILDGATLCKCAPPIRSEVNREQLWQALGEGVIDLVATDHSPCPPAMKHLGEGNFRRAWGGIASLSTALSVMWTEANRRGFSVEDIARWMAEKPAELAGCAARKGRIAAGYDADFVVFDCEAEFTLTEERLHYRHPVSPYLGQRFRGVIRQTYLRGRCIFSAGQFPGQPSGRECRPPERDSRHS